MCRVSLGRSSRVLSVGLTRGVNGPLNCTLVRMRYASTESSASLYCGGAAAVAAADGPAPRVPPAPDTGREAVTVMVSCTVVVVRMVAPPGLSVTAAPPAVRTADLAVQGAAGQAGLGRHEKAGRVRAGRECKA